MSSDASSRLLAAILDEIASEGPLTFARFMERALYEPGLGYYARPETTTGPAGDFSTSPDVSPDFGRRIALQVAEFHERLGSGAFRLVEIGPGRGLLAADLVDGLRERAPRSFERLEELLLIERNPALQDAQSQRLSPFEHGPPVRWAAALEDAVCEDGLPAIVVANELLDALPFHIVVRAKDGRLLERAIDGDGEGGLRFVEVTPGDPRLEERAGRFGLCPREGHVAEICLALEQLFEVAGARLGARAALFFDYGHEAATLADHDHAEGTAIAYHRHRVVDDLLARPGEQDITAHVNWTHVAWAAGRAGFDVAGRTTQDRFLLALGIIDDLVRRGDGAESSKARKRRLAARALVLGGPAAGRRFEALLLAKGLAGPFRGLGPPAAPAQRGVLDEPL